MAKPKIYFQIFNIENGKIYPIHPKNWDNREIDPFFENTEQAEEFIHGHFNDCNNDPAYTLVILPVYSVESKKIPKH